MKIRTLVFSLPLCRYIFLISFRFHIYLGKVGFSLRRKSRNLRVSHRRIFVFFVGKGFSKWWNAICPLRSGDLKKRGQISFSRSVCVDVFFSGVGVGAGMGDASPIGFSSRGDAFWFSYIYMWMEDEGCLVLYFFHIYIFVSDTVGDMILPLVPFTIWYDICNREFIRYVEIRYMIWYLICFLSFSNLYSLDTS